MRTETQLRELFTATPIDLDALTRLNGLVSALGEQPDSDVTTLRPARRRPARRVVPLLAAAAVVLAVAASFTAIAHLRADRPAAGGDDTSHVAPGVLRPVWRYSVGPVSGFTISRDTISRLETPTDLWQSGSVVGSGSRAHVTGQLAVELQPARLKDGAGELDTAQPVTVGGRPGLFVAGRHLSGDQLKPEIYRQPWPAARALNDYQPRLFWWFADGSIGTLTGTFGFRPESYDYDNGAARRDMLRIARAIRVGVSEPVTAPFALPRSLPHHVTVESYSERGGVICLGYGNGNPTEQSMYRGYWLGSVMTVCRPPTGPTRRATLAPTLIVEKESGCVSIRDLPDGSSLVVEVDPGGLKYVSCRAAEDLARRADVGPVTADRASWLTVR